MRNGLIGLVSPLVFAATMATAGCSSSSSGGGTGGSSSNGGQAGAGTGGAAATGDWAGWPMPNDQADVTAGAPNLESYADNGDGTVTDNVTGLMWQQTVPTGTYTWAQALAYCPTLTLANHGDWRLPSRIELVSIVDMGVTSGPMINNTHFPSTPTAVFWSASPVAGLPADAYIVDFFNGYTGYYIITGTNDVRCVR
jgi:hypothetical protein